MVQARRVFFVVLLVAGGALAIGVVALLRFAEGYSDAPGVLYALVAGIATGGAVFIVVGSRWFARDFGERRPQRLRGALALAAIFGLVAVGGALAWRSAYLGDPSAHELRDVIAQVARRDCPSKISVHGFGQLGGPTLPAGMSKARRIVCDAKVAAFERSGPGAEFDPPTLATQFVFSSHTAAERWIESNPQDRWAISGRTVVGAGELTGAEWLTVKTKLGLK